MQIKPQSLKNKVSSVDEVLDIVEEENGYSEVRLICGEKTTIKAPSPWAIISWLPASTFVIEFRYPDRDYLTRYEFECENPDLEMEEAYWMQFAPFRQVE